YVYIHVSFVSFTVITVPVMDFISYSLRFNKSLDTSINLDPDVDSGSSLSPDNTTVLGDNVRYSDLHGPRGYSSLEH
ncbi:hypothetical protein STEG23_023936, partial [Scotinomys teguina]